MTTTPFLSRLPSVGLALSSLMLLGVLSQGPGNQTPAPLPIGVVDLGKVIDAYPKAVQEQKKLEDLKKEIVEWTAGQLKNLKDLQLRRDAETGRARDIKDLQIDTGERELRGMRQIRDADLQEQFEKFVVWFHEDVDGVIAQIAKARNLQLVLRTQGKPGDKEPQSSKARSYDRRYVWYASEQIDITADVIKMLQMPPAPEGSAGKSGTQPGTPRTDGKE
jgi:Skp family chaperone for outer membrane proteins